MENNLDPFEEQLVKAEKENLSVHEKPFKTFDGLIVDNDIYLRSGMLVIQKSCVLSEERGHYHTGTGDILDQTNPNNSKLEMKGRKWAYDDRVGLFGLLRAYKDGRKTLYEMAQFLNVTEEFLKEALEAYRLKYGTGVRFDEYFIMFEPYLQIHEMYK